MTSRVILADDDTPVVLDGSGQFLFVGPQGALHPLSGPVPIGSHNVGLPVVVQALDTLVDNRGRISHTTGTAITIKSGSATVYNDGTIDSFFSTAIVNSGGILDLVNAGTIIGRAGIIYNEGGSFHNLGVISADVRGVSIFGASLTSFVNDGTIYGGISADRQIIGGLINRGTIVHSFYGLTDGASAISLPGPDEQRILNSGSVVGSIYFGTGNDLYDGRGGTTDGFVIGFLGNDTLIGGGEADSLRGDDGADLLQGGGGDDLLLGGIGNDILAGGPGVDTLDGGDGNDILRGGAAADFLDGGLGRDLLDYALSLAMSVNLGTAEVSGGDAAGDVFTGFENLAGGAGNDTLTGDALANALYGRAGHDLLSGAGGNDVLVGDIGNDTLDGGLGADVLRGGVGADAFRLAATTYSPNVAGQRDRIFDFVRAEGDRVDLALIDADVALVGNQAFTFVGNLAFTAAGQVRAVSSGGNYLVMGNMDANLATSEFALVMTTATTPLAADFIL